MSTAVGNDLLYELAVLSQGRNPSFTSQGEVLAGTTPAIPNSAVGVNVTDSILTQILVKLRRVANTHTVWVDIDSYIAGETYNVTLGGTLFSEVSGGGDTEADAKTALAATIDANANYNASYDATDGYIKITGAAEAAYTSVISATGGATMTQIADATTCDFEVWLRPFGRTDWFLANDGTFSTVVTNFTERVVTSGYDRMYIKISGHDGRVEPIVGPCTDETS